MGLPEKYAPKSTKELIGNFSHVFAELDKPDGSHVFLFDGPTGVGKGSLTALIAEHLGAFGFDYKFVNASDATGVDAIRELLDEYVAYPPMGNKKVIVLDESHRLSAAAWSALRVPTDTGNVPDWLYWVFTSSSANKIPKDNLGRMTHIVFPKISEDALFKLLKRVVASEEYSVSNDVLAGIVSASDGSARKALKNLESISSMPVDTQAEAVVHLGGDEDPQVIDLARSLYGSGSWGDIVKILKSLKDAGVDSEVVRRTLLSYGSSMLLNGNSKGIYCKHFIGNTYDDGFPGVVVMCYKAKHV